MNSSRKIETKTNVQFHSKALNVQENWIKRVRQARNIQNKKDWWELKIIRSKTFVITIIYRPKPSKFETNVYKCVYVFRSNLIVTLVSLFLWNIGIIELPNAQMILVVNTVLRKATSASDRLKFIKSISNHWQVFQFSSCGNK